MSILWLESFDIYGTSLTNMAQRGYIQSPDTISLTTNPAFVRTGSGALLVTNGVNVAVVERLAETALNVCCQGVAFYMFGNPANDVFHNTGMKFRVNGDINFITVNMNNTLGISIYVNGSLVANSPVNRYVNESWNWLETKVTTGINGSIEVRLNGETVVIANNININPVQGWALGKWFGFFTVDCAFDDWVINDEDFLGDRRVVTLFPNADTIDADWTPSSGTTGFNLIDETPPNDTGFITANNAGDISEFDKQNIPLDVNSVAAVCVIARAFKDNAGASTFTLGVNSAGNVVNSPQFNPNTTVSYFSQIFNENPDGNIPWTRNAVNDATIRITRVI